ncbi:MAG: sn-glycerol-3-phosphate ABC transporter ATP-binding protein UgpC [Ancalomicrobiaceae bacterium]|nr:sn-glycerol-3-phosphate ABC transporter ATP-binding protein UgpC [Ancalomicrobiaceae bacterium]
MTAEIDIRNVSKRFGSLTVLEDLSLKIPAHEFVVFLGPSGCGKSTLLRMIAGLESIDIGEIFINGEPIGHLPPGQRGVAMVFQSYALYPHMTVRQNMAFGLQNISVSSKVIAERVANAARMLEIGHLLDRKPGQLSGGQRQRVAIGRAVVKEPNAFLFDEPLSNLDAALRARTRVELAQLHQRLKSTMIFVTHDQMEAMTLADRIVVMNNKKIEQIGSPMDIYDRPATRFVAGFVGTPQMNFLNVTALATEPSGVRVECGALAVVAPFDAAAVGRATMLGIRAESVSVVRDGEGDIGATIDVLERLGDRSLVHARLADGQSVVANEAGQTRLKVGERIGLRFAGDKAHLFDADGVAFHVREAVS